MATLVNKTKKVSKSTKPSLVDAIHNETVVKVNFTTTENGALTNKSSLDAVLDFFALGGALRTSSENEVINIFAKAYGKDPLLALKCLFYFRDIRGAGQGERKTFRTLITWLAKTDPDVLTKNFNSIVEYGRYDDFLTLLDTPLQDKVLKFISIQFKKDLKNVNKTDSVSLLGKWIPSINASSKTTKRFARKIASYLKMNHREYRKNLKLLRDKINIVESNLCNKNYDNINYENVPSKASLLYRKAFFKNDKERYSSYLEKVKSGDAKINSGTLYPHEIINALGYGENNSSLELQWKSLPNYAEGVIRNVLPVIDVSGSMGSAISKNITAMDVAVALGLYFSERINGKFKNNFITFHETPKLLQIQGNTLFQKVQNIKSSDWGGSTNLQSVFDLILNTATKYKLEQSDLPTEVIIISDMEFNSGCNCNNKTNLQVIKEKYSMAGYVAPKLVFWNVMCRNKQTPATMNDDNVKLVSGFSPSILKSILSAKETNPFDFMLEVLNSERYEGVKI